MTAVGDLSAGAERGGRRLAVFVSPHGFGHAARASAVMAELNRRAGVTFELFSATPRWFFDETIPGAYRYHPVVTDVGFRQASALEFDLEGTVADLDAMLPFDAALVEVLADEVRSTGCSAVLCDIAPLGIAVAKAAGVPSVLVENFLWPWLYAPLFAKAPGLERHAAYLQKWFDAADVHVQTDPLCDPAGDADVRVPPISREPRTERLALRARLGVEPDAELVVLTMGGVAEALPFLDRLRALDPIRFLVTGADRTAVEGNLHLFAADERIYMPDFIRAADAVVGKLGYSTAAEVWARGCPMAYVTRADFRETAPLRAYVEARISGFEIPGDAFAGGAWAGRVPELLEMGDGGASESDDRAATHRSGAPRRGGAAAVTRIVLEAMQRG